MASRSWNRVELIGNLTRDPELRYTPNGAAVCTFGMATNRTYISDGEKKEEVDFHRLVSWNKLAELCNQLLKKGIRVFISGRLQTRTWEAQDGTQRNVTEIVIEDMIILSPKTMGPQDLASGEEAGLPPVSKEPAETPVETEEVKVSDEPKEAKKAKEEKEDSKQSPSEDVSPDEDLPF